MHGPHEPEEHHLTPASPVTGRDGLSSSDHALQDQLLQLRTAFDFVSDVVVITNAWTGEVVALNPAFERLHGIPQSQAMGKTVQQLRIWVNEKRRKEMVRIVLTKGVLRDFGAQVYNRDGQVVDIRLNVVMIELRESRCLIVTARDVTEVRRTRRALHQTQSRLMELFEGSPVPMAQVTSDDIYTTHYNAAWFATFGFDPKLAQGKSGLELGIWVHPEERSRAIEMARSDGETGEMEVLMRYADGSHHWIALRVRLQEDTGRTLFLFSYIDVTHRKVAQEQLALLNAHLEARVAEATQQLVVRNDTLEKALEGLRRAQVQLVETEKVAALGTLVAGLSHEINTPIGNSLLMSTTLEKRIERFLQQRQGLIEQDANLAEFVNHIQRVAQMLTRSVGKVSQLVTAFKQVAGDQPTENRCTFTVGTLLEGVDLATRELAIRSHCPIQFGKCPDADLAIDSYPAPMMAAIAQIVENAVLHGYQNGKLMGPVTVETRREDQSLLVVVTDFGVGIAKRDLTRIFDPFFTARMGQSGHGLGLSIVHKVVRGLLGGSIQVKSEGAMKGSCFQIRFPLVAPAQPQ